MTGWQKHKRKHGPRRAAKREADFGPIKAQRAADMEPDWAGHCSVCGAAPIVPATGLCGPCTFGDSETIGGNW